MSRNKFIQTESKLVFVNSKEKGTIGRNFSRVQSFFWGGKNAPKL
jgi:hypothetical protein